MSDKPFENTGGKQAPKPEPSVSPDRARLSALEERARAAAARASAEALLLLGAGAEDVAPREPGPLSLGLSQGRPSFPQLLPPAGAGVTAGGAAIQTKVPARMPPPYHLFICMRSGTACVHHVTYHH